MKKTKEHPHIEDKPVSQLHPNEKNPRKIKRADYERLKRSMIENPKGMRLHPVVYGKGGKLLAGNRRLEVALELGWKTIPAISAEHLTKKEQEHFILWDNEHVGTWDFDLLEKWEDTFGVSLPAPKSAVSIQPEDVKLRPFKRTHILLSFPPEKLVELERYLKPIQDKSYVEFEQGSN